MQTFEAHLRISQLSWVQGNTGASSYTDLLAEMPAVPPAFEVPVSNGNAAAANGNSGGGFAGSQFGAQQAPASPPAGRPACACACYMMVDSVFTTLPAT